MHVVSLWRILILYRFWILIPLALFEGPIVAFVVGTLSSRGYFNPYAAFGIFVAKDTVVDGVHLLFWVDSLAKSRSSRDCAGARPCDGRGKLCLQHVRQPVGALWVANHVRRETLFRIRASISGGRRHSCVSGGPLLSGTRSGSRWSSMPCCWSSASMAAIRSARRHGPFVSCSMSGSARP